MVSIMAITDETTMLFELYFSPFLRKPKASRHLCSKGQKYIIKKRKRKKEEAKVIMPPVAFQLFIVCR